MLYSQSIKNFVQGVSQQPPLLRFPEQLEEQINGFSTEVSGLQKRVPTVHLKTFTGLNLKGVNLLFISLTGISNRNTWLSLQITLSRFMT